jgi:sulfide:quinone oxidoreductase
MAHRRGRLTIAVMMPPAPHVIVAGGGPAAVETLLALRHHAGDRIGLELVAPDRDLVVRPYEVLTPFHEGWEHRYPLAEIAADLDVELTRDALAAVAPDRQTITLRSGAQHRYDALVIAIGARHAAALAGAIPFRGVRDAYKLKAVLLDSRAGRHRSVTFVIPNGFCWALPLYELALHTSAWLAERQVHGVPLALVSPEREPLASFGSRASAEVAAILDSHQVQFVTGHAVRFLDGRLLLAGGRELETDLAIALPRLYGPAIRGLPHDRDGYLPVDDWGRVQGAGSVFAAGDATSYPVKHGGIATQQADAVAERLASDFDLPVKAGAWPRPALRAVLFGGRDRRYLYAELGERLQESSRASVKPLWSTSSKLIGHHLTPYLHGLESVPTRAAASRL